MGGYGSLHLGFKYPEIFGVVSAMAPSITTFALEKREVLTSIFQDDTLYFNSNNPGTLAQKNVDHIRGKTVVRLLIGDKKFLLDLVQGFQQQLTDLKIDHQYVIGKGATIIKML